MLCSLNKAWKGYHGKTTSKHSQEKSVDFTNYRHKSKERFSTHSQKKNKVAVFYAREHRTLNFQLTQHSHYLSKTLSLSGEITRVVLIIVTFQIMTKIIQYSVSKLSPFTLMVWIEKTQTNCHGWPWAPVGLPFPRESPPQCGFDPTWPVKLEEKNK